MCCPIGAAEEEKYPMNAGFEQKSIGQMDLPLLWELKIILFTRLITIASLCYGNVFPKTDCFHTHDRLYFIAFSVFKILLLNFCTFFRVTTSRSTLPSERDNRDESDLRKKLPIII